MRTADVGALPNSASLDVILQRRRCRVKDWPYSQAAGQVCGFDLTFDAAALGVVLILGRVVCVGWKEARCELPLACCWLLMRCALGGPRKDVDIFNASSGLWSTAVLSVARAMIAATSLPSQGLAIFAGGLISGL
jgi:hypothetical protein